MPRQLKPKVGGYPLSALIREAPLTTQEKALLFVIASHKEGRSFARAAKLQRQTGMGRTTFYAVRKSLVERGILNAKESRGGATTYTVQKARLKELIELNATPIPHRGTPPVSHGSGARVPHPGTPAAAAGQTTPAGTPYTTPVAKRDQKGNTKTNTEESLNMKDMTQEPTTEPPRRVRRVRRPAGALPRVPDEMRATGTRVRPTTDSVRAQLEAFKQRDGRA